MQSVLCKTQADLFWAVPLGGDECYQLFHRPSFLAKRQAEASMSGIQNNGFTLQIGWKKNVVDAKIDVMIMTAVTR